ncbi:MAG: flagellar hook-length control protein FliK [Gammaproteobacteria bacterium]|nr:MAG: flagellar hook-length control protein FliK [Gammaproteobacteria bacterium]
MSGLTPILDTLLHQVLGKRVDVQPPRDSTEPVIQVRPGEPPRPVRSDSRLDPRLTTQPLKQTDQIEHARSTPRHGDNTTPHVTPKGKEPASTDVKMSTTARLLAAIQAAQDSAPGVIKSPPMTAAGSKQPVLTATALATHLQQSVTESGLFYESHLGKWYQGKLPLEQLSREPQMKWFQATTPRTMPERDGQSPSANRAQPQSSTPQVSTSAASGNTSNNPAPRQITESGGLLAPTPETEVEAEQQLRSASSERHATLHQQTRETSQELQGIVRHQLELLSHPVLRWEGEITPGMLMQMAIYPPEDERSQQEPPDRNPDADSPDRWRSDLRLTMPNLGEVSVTLSLQKNRLRLELFPTQAATRDKLVAELGSLIERLSDRGFGKPSVSVSSRSGDESG